MKQASAFDIGDPTAPQHLLIAYQGSQYKNTVVEIVTEHFSTSDIYIRGIDIGDLDSVHPEEWTAVFICHTWDLLGPPPKVRDFAGLHPAPSNAVFLCTSFNGRQGLEGVDAITSASRITRAEDDARNAIIRLEELID